jgi:hypothetical protein
MARWLFLLCVLALGSCEDLAEGGDRVDAEATAAWPFIPVRLALSDGLTRCQRAGMLAGVAYWEGLTDVRLFQVETATSQDETPGLRKLGTAVVLNAPTDNREQILDQTELTYVQGRTGELFHSAEVRVRGCSPRAYARPGLRRARPGRACVDARRGCAGRLGRVRGRAAESAGRACARALSPATHEIEVGPSNRVQSNQSVAAQWWGAALFFIGAAVVS